MKNKINPTTETQEKVINFLREKENLVSINFISKNTGIGWFSVKGSIDFLKKYGIVKTQLSNSGQMLIQLNRQSLSESSSLERKMKKFQEENPSPNPILDDEFVKFLEDSA